VDHSVMPLRGFTVYTARYP